MPGEARDRGTLRPRQGQLIANLALASWLAADAVRAFLLVRSLGSDLVDAAAGAALLLAAAFVLLRSEPRAQDARPGSIAVAIAATVLPVLLAWLVPLPGTTRLGLAVEIAAVALMAAGILWLGRNFSVLPQYRVAVLGGPYAVVRHPIYASYLLFDGALALEAGSLLAAGLWLAEAALLTARARLEERLLAASDAGYAAYLERVRWRFVPGIL